MAATIKNIIIFLFFLGLITHGYCQPKQLGPCSVASLSVKQTATGVKVQGKQEWLVTITNECYCFQSQVILKCPKFRTIAPVTPNIMNYSGDDYCHINLDKPILKQPVTFKYAWDKATSMTPFSALISC
ncbi:PREDICTED: uncharacterized protein LOC109354195 [Lupinus angustifolius]|uniref:uncharacterized protein LOC109354195 n=1 Tax=Lupinus angustifolius TaxID=3871 RepID=UPI00092E90F2|nr:PREDICTED: uncharacterized protein LOC109354195 [Lupinus angustifolius]